MSASLRSRGPIAWMARHPVTPNLLMLVLILGGLFMSSKIRQEVFPSFEQDTVSISVPLPGAAPDEVEQSVVLVIEEALRSVQGIDTLTARANEGSASLTAEIAADADRRDVYNNISQAIERITTFPEDAEEPTVALDQRRREVVELQLFGDVGERSLRMAAEQVRERLLLEDDISQVDLAGARPLEILIEIDRARLRAYDLTLGEVAETVRRVALDRSGGTLETAGGDILIRMSDRRDRAAGFAQIPIIADRRGTIVRLGDIADVRPALEDSDVVATFDGVPSIRLNVFRVGEETPISVADAVKRALPEAMATLPAAIQVATVDDDSEIYRARMELLLKNGFIGLCLVLLILSLFLEFKLAFWVAVGIPTAFLGTLLFLPWFDVSINMVSMFAFILALGIVVDDAIVAGENIHEYLQRGMSRIEAAVQGARDIAVPLSFSILTNIVAFIPLALVPGGFGKFWAVIPLVVSIAFLLSWIEALFVLPGHLANVKRRDPGRKLNLAERVQRAFSAALRWFVERIYGPLLSFVLSWRYATTAAMIGLLMVVMAWPVSGRMGFGLFPSIERDDAQVSATMPVDAPLEAALGVRDALEAAAERVIAAHGGDTLGKGIEAMVNGTDVSLTVYLQPPEVRPMSTEEFAALWREEAGPLPAARSVRFTSAWGGPGGTRGLSIQLSHSQVGTLAAAAADLARRLADFQAIEDEDDGFTPGKTQLEYGLTEAGRSLGLTSDEIARQVRAAFFGVEALRQQDGRNEVTVRVRLPAGERRSEADIETLVLRAPDGGEVPLAAVATVERSRAASAISREDGRRIVTVSANVEPSDQTNRILAAATDKILPQLARDYPGLGYAMAGRQATVDDTMNSFYFSSALALIIIYALLAIPFRSYVQPAIVMTAIPFGFVGAILGHLIMGMSLSIISIMGTIALSGVVINAALVMIDYANRAVDRGMTPQEAIWRAGKRRFRPILLTTMTTFGGLAPMIFETSRQAQFLIPMAVSLGYGIVFATAVVLVLIPSLYLILEDMRWLVNPQPRPPDPLRLENPVVEEKRAVAAE
ncbi:MAG TPA: efflux RND transporter permease subunit [Thermohalobaculum sp.]|nr:efflux RND transporter permease subunit [Thermohalobaculum sp.]